MSKSLKDRSREDWQATQDRGTLDVSELSLGALLRIADASERMALRYTELIEARDYWKNRAASTEQTLARARRRMSALNGVITRLKKQHRERPE